MYPFGSNSMANIIPIAGIGSRYSKQGYLLPKPFVPVSGVPMIIKAIRDMPPSDKWVFIVRQEYIDQYGIDLLLQEEISNPIIIPITRMTQGQACSAYLASPYVSPNESLFIAACDNGYLYDPKKYKTIISNLSNNAVVWTFTGDPLVLNNPNAWGWVKLASDQTTINDISCKQKISDSPISDHAIIGSFYFSKAKDFFSAVDLMIQDNYRINNEFYIDCVPIFLKKMGKKSVLFDVELYIGFGTPDALHFYEQIEYQILHNLTLAKDEQKTIRDYDKWTSYFRKNG